MWTCGPSERQRAEAGASAHLAGIAGKSLTSSALSPTSTAARTAFNSQPAGNGLCSVHSSLKYDAQHGKCRRCTRGLGLSI
jgi:hypothetical protein